MQPWQSSITYYIPASASLPPFLLQSTLKPTSYRAAHQNFCFFPLPFLLSYFPQFYAHSVQNCS